MGAYSPSIDALLNAWCEVRFLRSDCETGNFRIRKACACGGGYGYGYGTPIGTLVLSLPQLECSGKGVRQLPAYSPRLLRERNETAACILSACVWARQSNFGAPNPTGRVVNPAGRVVNSAGRVAALSLATLCACGGPPVEEAIAEKTTSARAPSSSKL